jgi:Flp pilus assembly pilin Flp
MLKRGDHPTISSLAERSCILVLNDSPNRDSADRANDSGQTTVEYAVITAFVVALAVVSFTALQASIVPFFANLAAQLGSLS